MSLEPCQAPLEEQRGHSTFGRSNEFADRFLCPPTPDERHGEAGSVEGDILLSIKQCFPFFIPDGAIEFEYEFMLTERS